MNRVLYDVLDKIQNSVSRRVVEADSFKKWCRYYTVVLGVRAYIVYCIEKVTEYIPMGHLKDKWDV
jgi:hypothetical protein